MTVLIIPTHECNFRCVYCFEDPKVTSAPDPMQLDLPAIQRSLNKLWAGSWNGSSIGIHGGECTVLRPNELEAVLKMAYNQSLKNEEGSNSYGCTSITTNAYNITDSYIKLFKKYNTDIGISMDGPEGLNVLRGPNPTNKDITKGYNRKLKKILRALNKEKIPTAGMCILHKENVGTQEKLDQLKDWFLWLNDIGINGGRTNPMYGTKWNKKYELSNEQLTHAFKELFDFNTEHQLRWNPYREMVDNLLGFSSSPCTFGQCDFFKTTTIAILPDGTITNCDRTFEDGLHVRAGKDEKKSGRYSSLAQIECRGCIFWEICYGACPCEGINGDWRTKSRFCESYYALYEHISRRLKGLLPNIQLTTTTDELEPFKLMSYVYTDSPSSYGNAPLKNGAPAPPMKQRDQRGTIVGGGTHGDQGHGDKPHGDSTGQLDEFGRPLK